MTSITSLSIKGCNSDPVPNTFFRQDGETEHAAIVFPGLGYTAQMPLLFYSRELLLSLKADVLTVDYDYNGRNFPALDGRERMRILYADVQPAYQALMSQRKYRRITFIGKSLGTRAMGYLLSNESLPSNVKAVWLTPLLKDVKLMAQMKQFNGPSLFISGASDPHYDSESMKEVQEATHGKVLLVEGGDHSLNIKDDIIRSIRELQRVIDGIKVFIAK